MEAPVPTDEELVERIKQGDNDSLEQLVSRYGDKVYSLVYRIVGDRHDAEDVLQDTFLNMMRSLAGFRGGSRFATWLYRVATNAALTRLRYKGKRETSESEFLDEVYSVRERTKAEGQLTDWSTDPESRLLNDEARKEMDGAIAELPEKYRVVFILRDVEGLPATEVAEVLDLSVPAVKSRLHRARLYLRNRLSDYFTGEGKKLGLPGNI